MRAKLLTLVLCLSGLWSACSKDAQEPTEALDGRMFLLVSADGFEPVEGTTPSVSFEGDQLSAYAGCNHLQSRYRVTDGRLALNGIGGTEIGCFGPRSGQDDWYGAFLTSRPRLELDGDELVLRGDEATLHFLDREVANPDRPLVATLWSVSAFVENGGVFGGGGPTGATIEPATLRFSADGAVEVDTGCNQGQGRYRVEGDRITLSDLAYTEEACDRPTLEEKVQAVLSDGALTFEIEAQQLRLMRGTVGLHLDAP